VFQRGESLEGEELIAYQSPLAPECRLKVDDMIPLKVRQEKGLSRKIGLKKRQSCSNGL
jgi:hypothetical protein